MSELKRKADDEIALVELFEIFWNGNYSYWLWPVSQPLSVSPMRNSLSQPTYRTTKLLSTSLIHSHLHDQTTPPTWTMKDAQLKQTEQKEPVAFVSELNKLNDIFTSEVLWEAQAELAFMKTAMNEMLQLC